MQLEQVPSDSDTIAAVATPPGRGGIAIVRMSGPDAYTMAAQILRRSDGTPMDIVPRRTLLGRAFHPRDHLPVDEVICLYMPGPRSYTGEDVVEIHCHGGPVPVEGVLSAVLSVGARPANPGEFTRRAFLNGRMDLTQAEAVADLIAARSRVAGRLALEQLEGRLGREIDRIRRGIIDLMASIEVVLDYPEEDIEQRQVADLRCGCEQILADLDALLASAFSGRAYREGVRTVILGRPNVGKSSLLNALLGRDRAIVTEVPGTTRDTVEEELVVDGLPLLLIDTAGIREGGDRVERIGVERARRAAERAELVLVVLDDSEGITDEDRALLTGVRGQGAPIVVVNKVDHRVEAVEGDAVGRLLPDAPVVRVSALLGTGIDSLARCIVRRVLGSADPGAGQEGVTITSARHERALESARESLATFVGALDASMPVDVASIDLREAVEHLGLITGESVTEDLLDTIFANYCLGK